MHKRNLFISAALTVFLLVILTGVVAAAKFSMNNPVTSQSAMQFSENQAANSPSEIPTAAVPMETDSSTLDPQTAAQVAANYLGQGDLYSVENVLLQGQNVYKVTFSSGNIAYLSLDGRLLGVEIPQFDNSFTSRFAEQEEHEEEHADD